jgi:hypothetical protein
VSDRPQSWNHQQQNHFPTVKPSARLGKRDALIAPAAEEVHMITRRGNKASTKKIKTLKAKSIVADKAKSVKGGPGCPSCGGGGRLLRDS